MNTVKINKHNACASLNRFFLKSSEEWCTINNNCPHIYKQTNQPTEKSKVSALQNSSKEPNIQPSKRWSLNHQRRPFGQIPVAWQCVSGYGDGCSSKRPGPLEAPELCHPPVLKDDSPPGSPCGWPQPSISKGERREKETTRSLSVMAAGHHDCISHATNRSSISLAT